VSSFSVSPVTKTLHLSSTINKTKGRRTYTRFQHSNIGQLDFNAKLFTVIGERNISTQEKLEQVQNILRINPPLDINAHFGNHNPNTALHFAFKINDYKAVVSLLREQNY